jgi:hypothetical protein
MKGKVKDVIPALAFSGVNSGGNSNMGSKRKKNNRSLLSQG